MAFHTWLNALLAVRTSGDKALLPPGNRSAITVKEPSGATVSLLGHTDDADVYFGMRNGQMLTFTITRANLVRIAVWVLWRWLFVELWLGVRARLWYWTVRRGLLSSLPKKAK